MITGKVFLENKPAQFVQVYESNSKGTPLLRNNQYTNTTTNEKGEYSINIPKSDTFNVAFKLVGTNGAILDANKVPAVLNLISNQDLDVIDVITTKPKKNYLWLLLAIPVIYLLIKKK
jgi:hypothetical protein